jgi:ribonuclease III
MTPEEIRAIEIRLGYIFLDQKLLVQALTRKAAAQEQRQKGNLCEDQEIFRTLGDAVLKAILTELLIYQGYTTRGSITQKKEKLENEENLSAMLRALEITPIVGIGERSIGVQEQPLALAETFEAIVAAIYKDGGYEIIKKLVVKWFSPLI